MLLPKKQNQTDLMSNVLYEKRWDKRIEFAGDGDSNPD
jgi:hypothetical protein